MAAAAKRIEFWYDFASTYSYLSAMRIEDLAAGSGVEVVWRPFLLGPIFKAQGWDSSPFNIYPAKGRYMVRDLQRICHGRRLEFALPERFPVSSLRATRLAVALPPEQVARFSRRVFLAEFAARKPIDDDAVLEAILTEIGLDFAAISDHAESPVCRTELRARVAEAQRLGIFGAPTIVTRDGDIFWGDDRLEMALAAAVKL